MTQPPTYTAVVSRWEHQWEVSVLDDVSGLLTTLHVDDLEQVEQAVRDYLWRRSGRAEPSLTIQVVRDGRELHDYRVRSPRPVRRSRRATEG